MCAVAADTGKRGPSEPAGCASGAALRSRTLRNDQLVHIHVFVRFCALAMAERSTFSTAGAIRLFTERSTMIASLPCGRGSDPPPGGPSAARCAYTGLLLCFHVVWFLMPAYFCRLLGRRLRRVTLERARRRKFAQLVAHHVFGHVDRNELLAVVHADVCPTNSGRIVERRDHVRMTFFSFAAFIASIFFEVVSTKRSLF
jgi:hypothetical protein